MKNPYMEDFPHGYFVPQASQGSFYRRTECEIQRVIPSMQSVCGMEIKMKNNTIRNMVETDKECVLAMMRVFYTSPAVLSNGSEEIFESDIDNCVGDCPYLEGYMFEEAGKVQGYAMVAKSFSTEFGKPCIWIEDLYIKPEYRGTGIGSRFITFIEEKYPDTVMRLEVEEENERAVRVYEKGGFQVLPYMEMKKE